MVPIYLIRHGESTSNQIIHSGGVGKLSNGNPKLTALGEKQAKCVSDFIDTESKKYEKLVVLSSSLSRAVNTCLIGTQNLSCDIKVLDSLQEYTPPEKNIKGLFNHNSNRIETDLTWKDFTNRVIAFAETMKEFKYPTFIFGHSLFFSVILSYIGSSQTYVIVDREISFHLPNCSISTVGYYVYDKEVKKRDHWRVYYTGNTSHIPLDVQTGGHV